MKILKQAAIALLIVITALIFSVLSLYVTMGTDDTEEATVGVITKSGFPVSFRETAPGMAWAQYDASRFWMNTLTWFLILLFAKIAIVKMKQNVSIRKSTLP
jgi:hypothetical protein